MNLNESYIKKLKELDLKFHGSGFSPSYHKNISHIKDDYLGQLFENITKIDFSELYPHIQIGLFYEGLIGNEWQEDIERVQWFLKNRKELKKLPSGEYQRWKIHCNSLYMKIKSPYVVEYMNMFYKDLQEKYKEVIYNNIDILYLNISKSNTPISDQIPELKDFEYDSTPINYFYSESFGNYVEQDEFGNINTADYKIGYKRDNLINLIKREIRRRKLEKLGII